MNKTHIKLTPTERHQHRSRNRRRLVVLVTLVVLAFIVYFRYVRGAPTTYRSIEAHFKYGSIGSDIENGIPADILFVLPAVFPEYLPEGPKSPRDLTAFGFIQEPGHDRPIGFSERKRVIPLTGLNCAACHVGVVRDDPESPGLLVLGMPSNTVNLGAYFQFLFDCASDERFEGDTIIDAIRERKGWVDPVYAFVYRQAMPRLQAALLLRKGQLAPLFAPGHPDFGPGRVDTFNPYKLIQFERYFRGRLLPPEQLIGTADFPSIWNQGMRDGLNLHWDGNNPSVDERNVSASFGAGATRDNVDIESIERVTAWLWNLTPPTMPFVRIDEAASSRGARIFNAYCFDCHGEGGSRLGKVEALADIGTSRWRLDSYTEELAELQRAYGQEYDAWTLESFRKTDGYANAPLDGLWARAPYLHNGSVPTVWDLLQPENKRPVTFYRGHGVLDIEKLGIRADIERAGGFRSYLFDTSEDGNANHGHSGPAYGTELSEREKLDLIEHLKTL